MPLPHTPPLALKDVRRIVGRAWCEALERRTLFAGTPLWVTEAVPATGRELLIDGSPGDDRISVVAYGDTLTLANKGGWSLTVPNHFDLIRINAAKGNDVVIVDGSVTTDSVVHGSNGDDTIMAGAGNDRIYGGFGRDRILGGAGDDTIVTIGDSVQERVSGDDGFDSFWTDVHRTEVITDASPDETAGGAVHRVASFLTSAAPEPTTGSENAAPPDPAAVEAAITASRTLAGQDLPDPIGALRQTANFGNFPLFSAAGPALTDIRQGGIGDCYFLASLAALLVHDTSVVRQSIAELGDGTYAVRYHRDAQEVYVRVDADLQTSGYAAPLWYAKQGAQGSIWVALMEKAFTFFRTGEGTYASIHSGWMSEVFSALGLPSETIWYNTKLTPDEVATRVQAALDAGAAVTYATWDIPTGVPLIGAHAYAVESVTFDADGTPLTLRLRNPWGRDGNTLISGYDGTDDGWVTITPEIAMASMTAFMFTRV